MKIEEAVAGRMTETGQSLLRLIQNHGTPTLDLFVREAFQNSLDAADRNTSHKSVDTEIITGTFSTGELAPYFDTIENNLRRKYPGDNSFLAFRDVNTTGLTGPLRDTDIDDKNGDYGNLLKLVYEISRPQSEEGSGGSWGLGKTIYYRVGIGLVLFYSRIFNELTYEYEDRLAAALVEDQTKADTLLPKRKLGRGIAWWGQEDPKNSRKTIALTDEDDIDEILDVFGIDPYSDDQTGTTIIIPYVDEDKLLEETKQQSSDLQHTPYWTEKGIIDYLKVAVQRWYCPRLNNKEYLYGKYVRVFMNGSLLKKSEMAPVFRVIQALYNARPSNTDNSYENYEIYSKEIRLNNVFSASSTNNTAGYINYILIDEQGLGMLPPENYESPFSYVAKDSDDSGNPPIISFVRRPGMIVNYETVGDWTNGIRYTAGNEFILGIFVAKSTSRLASTNASFEEYLRACEKADHMSWHDPVQSGTSKRGIVRRIQSNCVKKVKETFAEKKDNTGNVSNIGLGRALADLFLPQEGFVSWDKGAGGAAAGGGGVGGSLPGKGGKSGGGGSASRGQSFSMRVADSPLITSDYISINATLIFGKKPCGVLQAEINSETGALDALDWRDRIGTRFPAYIRGMTVNAIYKGKKKAKSLFEGEHRIEKNCEFNGFKFEFVGEERDVVRIYAPTDDYYSVNCTIRYCITQDDLTGTLSFREGGEEQWH